MDANLSKLISQCQTDLNKSGFCLIDCLKFSNIREELLEDIQNENYDGVDAKFQRYLSPNGILFKLLENFCSVKDIEFIISLREAKNEWEEDGIWHDDGSRILAFSLSLTQARLSGGVLEFREKGRTDSNKIPTPPFGTMIIFKTGIDNFEHKINMVTEGSRLIIAGWCYPDK